MTDPRLTTVKEFLEPYRKDPEDYLKVSFDAYWEIYSSFDMREPNQIVVRFYRLDSRPNIIRICISSSNIYQPYNKNKTYKTIPITEAREVWNTLFSLGFKLSE
jgi:hypothetical protein